MSVSQKQFHINLVAYTRNISHIPVALTRELIPPSPTEVWSRESRAGVATQHARALDAFYPAAPPATMLLGLHLCCRQRRKGRKRALSHPGGAAGSPAQHTCSPRGWGLGRGSQRSRRGSGEQAPGLWRWAGPFPKGDEEKGDGQAHDSSFLNFSVFFYRHRWWWWWHRWHFGCYDAFLC